VWIINTKINLGEVGWTGMDWIDLVQDRNQRRAIDNMALKLRIPQILGSFKVGAATRKRLLHGVSQLVVLKYFRHAIFV
jgi:hypothetical protein